MTKRYIFIGDIHGCLVELERLLGKIEPRRHDVVVSLGDIIGKGPHPGECVELWRDRGYSGVLGNTEVKMLRSAKRFAPTPAGRARRKMAAYLSKWPRWIDFPHPGVLAVHGGVLPGTTVKDLPKHEGLVTELRHIRPDAAGWKPVAKGREKEGDVFWADVWSGNRVIVYGHTPQRKPKLTSNTIGLDTGCVYGGRLSAAVLEGGQWTIVSVRAARAYTERK